jgi:HAE1 family hydrophobic/amphiphilic exporter-1
LKKAVKELENIIVKVPFSDPDIHDGISGVNREIAGSLRSLVYALLFAIVLVYMILASQFESLKLPFIIMFVAPMGVIGVSLGLILSGTAISVMSTIGMIILSGIIVNDAILLVDYTNQLRKKGVPVEKAVKEAAATRLRPILMTTFTTVLGLLPLAVGIGSGAELQSAMAIAVIGGMLSATFLTLILIPVLYTIFEKTS